MSEELPRVLSLLSHELRGPLGVIRGYLRLIIQTGHELSNRSRESIEAALRASDRMGHILDEASFFAQLQMGDVRLEPKRVPLTAVVHAAIQAAGLPADSRVDLDSETLPNVTLDADEPRLRMALATFVSAVARAQSSNVVVQISGAQTRLGGKRAVRLRIAPRSMSGVDATEGELNAKRGGFGLAIPIAAVIVEGHGGRVRESRHGDRSAGLLVTLPTVE
jgi:two-component system OmpR family sensor kinase